MNEKASEHGSPSAAEIQSVLGAIWKVALGVDPAPEDKFYDLGGDSLRLVRVLELARTAGLTLTLLDMLSDLSLADLSAHLWRADQAPPSLLPRVETLWSDRQVPARPTAVPHHHAGTDPTATPAVIIPGGNGSPAWVPDFLAEEKPTRDVWGLESVGLHDGNRPLVDIEDMARAATRAITNIGLRRVHLIGVCHGASVAWSARTCLTEAGVDVRSITLVDVSPPAADAPELAWTLDDFLLYHVHATQHRHGTDIPATMAALRSSGTVPAAVTDDEFLAVHSAWAAHSYSAPRWSPEPLGGAVHLMVPGDVVPPDDGWKLLDRDRTRVTIAADVTNAKDLLHSAGPQRSLWEFIAEADRLAEVATN